MKSTVIDPRDGETVIDQFAGEDRKHLAHALAKDFRSFHHCRRPRIEETELEFRPGDKFPKS
jgi:hypothetical protein